MRSVVSFLTESEQVAFLAVAPLVVFIANPQPLPKFTYYFSPPPPLPPAAFFFLVAATGLGSLARRRTRCPRHQAWIRMAAASSLMALGRKHEHEMCGFLPLRPTHFSAASFILRLRLRSWTQTFSYSLYISVSSVRGGRVR